MLRKVFDKFFKGDENIVKKLMDISIYMSINKDKRINQSEYFYIIKGLIYVIKCIISDIAYLVSKLHRLTNNSNMDH